MSIALDTPIVATAGTLSFTGYDVDLTFGLTPDLGSISITGFDASVTVGGNVEIDPVNASIAITGQDTSAITNSLVEPADATLSVTGQGATLDFNAQVVPGTASLLINGRPATVTAIFIITSTKNVVAALCKPLLRNIITNMVD